MLQLQHPAALRVHACLVFWLSLGGGHHKRCVLGQFQAAHAPASTFLKLLVMLMSGGWNSATPLRQADRESVYRDSCCGHRWRPPIKASPHENPTVPTSVSAASGRLTLLNASPQSTG